MTERWEYLNDRRPRVVRRSTRYRTQWFGLLRSRRGVAWVWFISKEDAVAWQDGRR